MRGEESIKALGHRESLNPNLYCQWSKRCLKRGPPFSGDTPRSDPVIRGRIERHYRPMKGNPSSFF